MFEMQYLVPIAIVALVFGLKGFREVKDYLLKKEQIKADALVRSEALRLKNEIELEKLIQNDGRNMSGAQAPNSEEVQNSKGVNKDRVRD